MDTSPLPKASPDALPEVAAYLAPFASLFHRPSQHSLERYITGLLTDLPRKNCDTIAAAVAGTSTERLQHLLTDATWDSLALDQARVQQLVAQSPAEGILVLDDTGLPKQGTASVGVARQYSGTLGKIGNCQILVSAEYVEDEPASSTPLHWPVSAQLYLPELWAADPARRARAHSSARGDHANQVGERSDAGGSRPRLGRALCPGRGGRRLGRPSAVSAGAGGAAGALCLRRRAHLRRPLAR
jgi:SRSO17 transposase